MPTYRYRCERGHEFEVAQSVKDEPLAECQTADEYKIACPEPVRRLISAPGIIWVGGAPTPKFHGK